MSGPSIGTNESLRAPPLAVSSRILQQVKQPVEIKDAWPDVLDFSEEASISRSDSVGRKAMASEANLSQDKK